MTSTTPHVRCVKRSALVALIGLVGVLSNSTVHATPILSLELQDVPDILVQFIAVDYNATTNLLTADGIAAQYDDDGVGAAELIVGGSSSISSIIDDVGFTSGSLVVTGTIPSLGFFSGTLLTGTLTAGGTPPPPGISDQLHFTFDATGGDLLPDYSAGTGGIVMSDTGFPGDFANDFSNTGLGFADISLVVPEPSSVVLLGLFSASLLVFPFRKRTALGS